MIRKCTDEYISDEEIEKKMVELGILSLAIKMHLVLLNNIDLKDI